MADTPDTLIREMYDFSQASYPDTDIDLAPRFADRARALGERELLVHVFRTFTDSELSFWMDMLRFVWSDIAYETWLEILDALSDDRRFVYQFLWFASIYLALDITRLEVSHPNVRAELRSDAFRQGAPRPISRELRIRLEDDFDYETLWRRLESEGAPIQEFPSND